MFKKSANPKVAELNKSWTKRSYNLGGLSAVKRDLLRYCAWCGEGRLHHGNQKYCKEDCQNFAMAWSYPQKEQGLYYLLQNQEFKCAICKYDYVPLFEQTVARWNNMSSYWEPWDYKNKFSWHHIKEVKQRAPKDRRLEVDHIIPIYKGGQSLGLDNHQAICYSCHKAKTSKDLTGRKKMKIIRIEEVEQSVNAFVEANGGAAPTHILMTIEQQDELSEFFKSKQLMVTTPGNESQSKVVSLQVKPDLAVDILAVAAARTGMTNQVDYPVLLNLSVGEKK